MKKITFLNKKGGVGKSTSTVNVAATFCKMRNKKVLVVDCDSAGTSSKYLLTYTDKKGYTLQDVFNGVDVHEALEQVHIGSKKDDCIDIYVLSAFSGLDSMEVEDFNLFKDILAPLETEFDYCFFDMPPCITNISLSALVASDYVIVPAEATVDALTGFNDLLDIIANIREQGLNNHIEILGVLINNVIHQRAVQKLLLREMKENLGDLAFKQHIKSGSVFEQARYYGLPLPYFSASSEQAGQYRTLVTEIEKKIKMKERVRNA